MEKIYDVTALGEMLIDFAVNGESEQGNQLFFFQVCSTLPARVVRRVMCLQC